MGLSKADVGRRFSGPSKTLTDAHFLMYSAISGEATSPALREDIRRCLREMGAAQPVIFNRYGSTELGAFAQCQEEGD